MIKKPHIFDASLIESFIFSITHLIFQSRRIFLFCFEKQNRKVEKKKIPIELESKMHVKMHVSNFET